MFQKILSDFRNEFESQINSQDEEKNTELFWDEMKKKKNFQLINETWSDTVYPETEWLDWYDVMHAIEKDWWNIVSIIWEWPYSIYWYKGEQLVHYIEGELYYYKFK